MRTHAQMIRAKLDDPATSTAEYRAAWNEWQAIVFQQNVATAMGTKFQGELQVRNGWVAHTPAGIVNHTPAR